MRRAPTNRTVRTPRALALLLVTALLVGACGTVDNRPGAPTIALSPTSTLTPLGEVLQIDGRTVREVVVPPDGREALYALTDADLYVRESGEWVATGSGADLRALLVDPRQTERLFRGNHPPCWDGAAPELFALELSEDSGRSWQSLPQGRNIRPLVFDPDLPEVVYGSDCRLAITTTSGYTWTHYDPLPGYVVTDVALYREQLLVLASTPGGSSRLFTIDISEPEAPEYGEALLELDGGASLDVQQDRIAVGGADTVYISDDGGASWAESRVGLEAVTSAANLQPLRHLAVEVVDPSGIHVIRIAPHDAQRLYAGTAYGLFLTQDDGATWVRYDAIPASTPILDIQLALDDADLYVTTDGGVVVVPAP